MSTYTGHLLGEDDLLDGAELEDVSENIIDDTSDGSNSRENVCTLLVKQV
jgi:hypothetical protein